MNTVIWIDLEEAAQCLSIGTDELICLIQEGPLDSKFSRHAGIVVRADEGARLAKAFKVSKPRRRRVAAHKRSMVQSASACRLLICS
jgi:hypothetical protein